MAEPQTEPTPLQTADGPVPQQIKFSKYASIENHTLEAAIADFTAEGHTGKEWVATEKGAIRYWINQNTLAYLLSSLPSRSSPRSKLFVSHRRKESEMRKEIGTNGSR